MTKAKFALVAFLLFLPCGFMGCGGSEEVTVVPEAVMTEDEEATYEAESYGNTNDQSQN